MFTENVLKTFIECFSVRHYCVNIISLLLLDFFAIIGVVGGVAAFVAVFDFSLLIVQLG